VLSEAATQLSIWRSFPEIEGAFTGILGYHAPRFHIESWHADYEMETSYRTRMEAKFEAALESHIRDVKHR
jgi:hypothetical protein